jgi:integrase
MPQLPNDQRSVDRLTEAGEYRSEKVTGLLLDIREGGSRKWRVKFQIGKGSGRKFKTWTIGDARKVAIGAAEAEARARLAKIELTKKDPRKDTTGETFDALVRDWIEKHGKAHKRSWPRDLKMYETHIAPLLGTHVAVNIERQDVISVLDHIAKNVGKKGIQANRAQSLISACFKWALDEGRVQHHPATSIRKRKPENRRDRFLLPDELRAIWAALDDFPQVIGDAIRLLALLGQRDGEVAGMSKRELELREGYEGAPVWTLPSERTKNKRRHVIPLPPMATAIIRRSIGGSDSPFVFTTRVVNATPLHPTTLSSRFHDLMDDLKIEGATLHVLRHTMKTYMAEMGVPDEVADKVQNHITGRRERGAAAGYDHSTRLEERRRALALWQHRLMEMAEGRHSSGLRWIENEPGRGSVAVVAEPDPALDAEYGPALR